MNFLVTGGTGYIGSHVCVELLNADHTVTIIDNLSNSKAEVIDRINTISGKNISFHQIDLLDYNLLTEILRNSKFDAVIHFAGHKAVGESCEKPLDYYHNNVTGTINLLRAMQESGINRIVFSSSATVYGDNPDVPYTEKHPLKTINPYGRTKLFIEEILKDCCSANGNLMVAVLRYFNPVGAHQSGLIGEDPMGIPNNLMPFIAQVASRKIRQLSVFGNDYPTPDGTCIRDYVHVVDLAKGHVCALDKLFARTGLFCYNLGTGKGTSVLEMIAAFGKANRVTIPFQITSRRSGDNAICFADVTKAKRELRWEANLNVIDMCRDAWTWQNNNPS
ncbi:MAG: UDP-glucose 4-epimerase GalE [Candidatus Cloacimonetes bacterium]|nr:UDP-glucose 4-epimerase GalE [Candidatus Cloacimonadota bacterium]